MAAAGGGYQQSTAGALTLYHRDLSVVQIYSARWREYLLPWHSNPLVPNRIKRYEEANLHGSNFTEQSLFLGYTNGMISYLPTPEISREGGMEATLAYKAYFIPSELPGDWEPEFKRRALELLRE